MISVPCGSVYLLSADVPPVARVRSGDRVAVETEDANNGLVRVTGKVSREIAAAISARSCPLSGPIYVEEAEPGDLLRVNITGIECGSYGCAIVGPGFSAFEDWFPAHDALVAKIGNGKLDLGKGFLLQAAPMVGTIATCPAEEAIFSWKQGRHGGNMDCKYIRAGAAVYLPVAVPGALLFLGDCHASQGDGELAPPLEIPAVVELRIDVVKGNPLELTWPRVEVEEGYVTIASDRTFDVAAREAAREMVSWLQSLTGLDQKRAFVLMGQIVDIRAAQISNTFHTAYCFAPRLQIGALGG